VFHELRVVSEQLVEPAHDLESRIDRVEDVRPERVRDEAALIGDADQQRRWRKRERLTNRCDDRRGPAKPRQ